ncbi:hypothetical protein GOODEAATRI_025758, partial [Goodea atripinnis]
PSVAAELKGNPGLVLALPLSSGLLTPKPVRADGCTPESEYREIRKHPCWLEISNMVTRITAPVSSFQSLILIRQ